MKSLNKTPRLPFKLLNIRDGFAANSSSTHSLLILREDDKISYRDEDWDFTGEPFQVSTKEGKLTYLWAGVRRALRDEVGHHNAAIILDKMGIRPHVDGRTVAGAAWIDIPSEWTGSHPNLEFLAALRDALERDDTVILGESDDHDYRYAYDRSIPFYSFDDSSSDGAVIRYDPKARCWTQFSRATGMKFRFSIEDTETPTKGSLPELVDLKITNWCDIGCKACYQGSTRSGRHANVEYLEKVVEALASHQVFEVAIGGGEAVGHPWFGELATSLRENHIIPNLTTRRLDWLAANPDIVAKLGAVAYSTETAAGVDDYAKVPMPKDVQRVVQVIDGLVPPAELKEIFRRAFSHNMRVTLLGYKTTGRGARYASKLVAAPWYEWYTEAWFSRWLFSIDTALARQYSAEIERLDATPYSYHTEEGAWSCYIDAVAGKLGPSSYSHPETMADLDDPNRLGELFWNLTPEDGSEPNPNTARAVPVAISRRR